LNSYWWAYMKVFGGGGFANWGGEERNHKIITITRYGLSGKNRGIVKLWNIRQGSKRLCEEVYCNEAHV